MVSLLIAGTLASCGAPAADPLGSFGGASLTIVARDLTFDPVIVSMPAGQPLRLILDNRDEGIAHNLHVFQGDTDFGTSPSVIGTGLTAVELPSMPPGSYQFECTLHPDMIGTLIVAMGATPGPTLADDSTPSDSLASDDSLAPSGTKAARATRPPSAAPTPRPAPTP